MVQPDASGSEEKPTTSAPQPPTSFSRDDLFQVLKSLPPDALAALVAFGVTPTPGSSGILPAAFTAPSASPQTSQPLPSYNLGKAVSEFRGPSFHGNLDEVLSRWIESIEEGFRLWSVPDKHKVDFAAAFLKDSAKEWYREMDRSLRQAAQDEEEDEIFRDVLSGFSSWGELKAALVDRFTRDELAHEALAELFALRMTGSLSDYYQQFETVRGCIPSSLLPEGVKMAAFKAGLCSATACALKAGEPPKTYLDLVARCQQLDATFSRRPAESHTTSEKVAVFKDSKGSGKSRRKDKKKAKGETSGEKKESKDTQAGKAQRSQA